MSAVAPPTVFVAVPVWRGEAVVGETLRSIQDQTWPHWRAVVSVDGADDASADAVRPFLEDPRVTLVVQPERLGWAGNLNALMMWCDGEYWMYWQQDDLCASTYLERLVAHLETHAAAGAAFADLQWFGGRIERVHTPSVRGFALQRVLTQAESLSYLPFRGVIRREVLAAAGPLRLTAPGAAFEDLAWNVQLAREAEIHHVEGTLYFKRAHAGTAHAVWSRWAPERRRAAWLECAIGILEAALPVVPAFERGRLLEVVVDRFALARPGRALAYDASADGPAAVERFVADLALEAARRLEIPASSTPTGHDDAAAWVLARALGRDAVLAGIASQLAAGGVVGFAPDAPGVALLGRGWSSPEAFGVWSAAKRMELLVPAPAGETCVVRLTGHVFTGGLAGGARRRVVARAGDQVAAIEATSEAPSVALEITLDRTAPRTLEGIVLVLECPDAVSPAALGIGEDARRLGVALTGLGRSAAGDSRPAAEDGPR